MTIFGLIIGSVPGNPEAIDLLAQQIRGNKTTIENSGQDLVSIRDSGAPSWQGDSKDAFELAVDGSSKNAMRFEDGLSDGEFALEEYAAVLRAQNSRLDEVRDNLDIASDTFYKRLPFPSFSDITAYLRSHRDACVDYALALSAAKMAATQCAAKLREALHLEAVNLDGNKNVGSRVDLSDTEIQSIIAELKNMDYKNVNQGSIGDCYFLSAIISLMNTRKGKDWINSCIRVAYDENGKPTGFYVTIYDDPLNPDENTKQIVFVDNWYENGVTTKSGQPGVASIFESAYGQIHPDGTLDTNKGINGGLFGYGAEDLTGHSPIFLEPSSGEYSQSQKEQAISALGNSQPVGTGTGWTDPNLFPNGSASVSAEINGTNTQIKLIHKHAYAIIGADENGITLVNPHGHNTDSSGKTVSGTFTLDWDTYAKYYKHIDIGGY